MKQTDQVQTENLLYQVFLSDRFALENVREVETDNTYRFIF